MSNVEPRGERRETLEDMHEREERERTEKEDAIEDALYQSIRREFNKIKFPAPFVCVCEHGRLDDVKYFIEHYQQCGFTSAKEIVNSIGHPSVAGWDLSNDEYDCYYEASGLHMAVTNECVNVVKYLLSIPEVDDLSITEGSHSQEGLLHCAAIKLKNSTEILEMLLSHPLMTPEIINQTAGSGWEYTALDCCINSNERSIKDDMIKLFREFGGKTYQETKMELWYEKSKNIETVEDLESLYTEAYKPKPNDEESEECSEDEEDEEEDDDDPIVPFLIACREGHLEDVMFFVKEFQQPNNEFANVNDMINNTNGGHCLFASMDVYKHVNVLEYCSSCLG